jgi:hypothetical protein
MKRKQGNCAATVWTAAWLIALAMLAGGSSACGDCTTGTCSGNTGGNAKGIYIENAGNYCLPDSNNVPTFCPEAFVNTSSKVWLDAQDEQNPGTFYSFAVSGVLADSLNGVDVVGVSSDHTDFAVTYKTIPDDGTIHTAQGTDLNNLILRIHTSRVEKNVDVPYTFWLGFTYEGATADYKIHQYTVNYALAKQGENPGEANWIGYCQEGTKFLTSSFLEGKRISGLNAAVEPYPEVVTMACDTGAIVACLHWGYAPWSTQTGAPDKSEDLFASCLQAKRAAYFVGQGDFTSYTKTGTPISRWDPYGILSEDMNMLEAIWSPQGVVCFTPEHARGYQKAGYPQVTNVHNVPQCANDAWSTAGKLATGKID